MKINLTIATQSKIHVEFITPENLKKHKLYKKLYNNGFDATEGSLTLLDDKRLLACGSQTLKTDDIRVATVAAIKKLKATNFKSCSFPVTKATLQGVVEGIILGGYEFNDYKSKKTKTKLKKIDLVCDDVATLQKDFEQSVIIAEATAFTRDIVNTAPQELNPKTFAKLAEKLAANNNLECNILGPKKLKKEKCNAMLAVGRASVHPSQLIHLAYKPKNAKKVITLVGKGLTYDSGGLSLKPATSMVTMKMDKAGASAVLGMIKAVSELKLDVEVHAFIGAVENMIGGDAYKPDDILKTRSGKTVEVRNTDAEGRLVLADVLDYAQDKVPNTDYLFDFATLTGACMVALGQYTTGVMGHSKKVKHHFYKASKNSGELIGSLPFNKHLNKLLKSEIADLSNVASKPYGGAITAGLFLDNFIKEQNKQKWLHFDIAGSAYTEAPWDCNVYGATGAGVRLMSQFFKEIAK